MNTRTLKDQSLVDLMASPEVEKLSFHAKRFVAEEYLGELCFDPELRTKIIELLTAFDDEGHSGFSSSFGIYSTQAILRKGFQILNEQGQWDWTSLPDDIITNDRSLKNSDRRVLETMATFKATLDQIQILLKTFSAIARQEPLTPLTGGSDEFNGHRQNTRLSTIFKDDKANVFYNLEGVSLFNYGGGNGWSNPLNNRVIEFPYDGERLLITVKKDEETGELLADPRPVGDQVTLGMVLHTPKRQAYRVAEIRDDGTVLLHSDYLEDRIVTREELSGTQVISYQNYCRTEIIERSFEVANWGHLKEDDTNNND